MTPQASQRLMQLAFNQRKRRDHSSVVVTAANVHDITPAAELLHADEEVVYGDAGYQGIVIRPEMEGVTTECRVAMRLGKRRALPDTPEGRLQDLIETAKAHIRSKGEDHSG